MNKLMLALLASAVITSPLLAQDTVNSTSNSGSNATANNASTSGASSDNQNANVQGQQQANTLNGNIGRSEANSGSSSVATTESTSVSRAASDQNQMQGQSATNQQGVTTTLTFNSTNRKTTEVRQNSNVPLAASSSFSSDYCGGTASGGASASPIGISIGGAAPVFDEVCRGLRRAERFGMIAANYNNLGQPEMALRAMSMMVWETCTANGAANRSKRETSRPSKSTVDACAAMGLLGDGSASQPIPASVPSCNASTSCTVEPKVSAKQEEKRRQDAAQATTTTTTAQAVAYATPR